MKMDIISNDEMVISLDEKYPICKFKNYIYEIENLLFDENETVKLSVKEMKKIAIELEACKNILGIIERFKI